MKIEDPGIYFGKRIKVYCKNGSIMDGWLDSCRWDYEEPTDDYIPYDGKYDDGKEHLVLNIKLADRFIWEGVLFDIIEEEIDHIEILS